MRPAGGHTGQFLEPGATAAAVVCVVGLHEGAQITGFFEQNAAPGMRAGHRAEIGQEFRCVEPLEQSAPVSNVFARKLNRRTHFDIARGTDVVADANRCGTQGFTFMVPVGVNDHERRLRPDIYDKTSEFEDLFRRKSEFRRRVRAHRTIHIVPKVVYATVHQVTNKTLSRQVVYVGLADARGYARDEALLPTPAQGVHGLFVNVLPAPALVADTLEDLRR